MRRIGLGRQVAARQLVLALGPRLHARDSVGDRELDGLVIAQLEMQAGMVLDGAPVAAVEAIAADHVQRAGNGTLAPHGHDQEAAFAGRRADQRERLAVEIGPSPLA